MSGRGPRRIRAGVERLIARPAARIASEDEGSMLPLIAAFAALAAALVLVVLAATSLYVEHKELFSLADGAALAGAESFPIDRAPDAPGELPPLEDAEVRGAVDDYLRAGPHPGVEDVVVERAVTPDGRTAAVTLSGWWRPPVLTVLVPDGIRIEVTATARSVLR